MAPKQHTSIILGESKGLLFTLMQSAGRLTKSLFNRLIGSGSYFSPASALRPFEKERRKASETSTNLSKQAFR
jgi:hypothetical protein